MFSRFLFVLPLLSLTPLAFAQPPDVPSIIEKLPANTPVIGMRVGPPDPPLITLPELQKLTGGPTLVTFSGRDVPAKQIIQTLRDAVQLPPSNLSTEELKPVTVDWMNVPFWKAAREVEKQSGGHWSTGTNIGLFWNTGADTELYLTPDSTSPDFMNDMPNLSGRVVAQTPFITLIANSMSRIAERKVLLGDEEGQFQVVPLDIHLSMTAYFDPKLKVRSVELLDLKFQAPAIQDHFPLNRLKLSSTKDSTENSNFIRKMIISIPDAIATGTKLTRISGMLHSLLVTASETWKVPDLLAARPATRAIGAGQYAFEGAEIKDGKLVLHLSAQTGVPPRTDTASFTSVRVSDAQGREIQGRMTRLDGQKSDFSLDLTQAMPGPYSLDWNITTQIKSLDVPFELRDVVVP